MAKRRNKLQKAKEDNCSKYWRNKADRQWIILIHRAGVCAVCGSTRYCQAHHLFPREIKHLRHDPDNGILLCCDHHKYAKGLSAHKSPLAFAYWFQTTHPNRWQWAIETIDKYNKGNIPELNYKAAYEKLFKLNQEIDDALLRTEESRDRDTQRTTEQIQVDPTTNQKADQASRIIEVTNSGRPTEGNQTTAEESKGR